MHKYPRSVVSYIQLGAAAMLSMLSQLRK